jgi:hypothetical protein
VINDKDFVFSSLANHYQQNASDPSLLFFCLPEDGFIGLPNLLFRAYQFMMRYLEIKLCLLVFWFV